MQKLGDILTPNVSLEVVPGPGPKDLLAELDGDSPRPLASSSAWSLLQRGFEINPDGTALIVAQQPSNHLKGLVEPSPPLADCLTWSYKQLRRGAARLASVFEDRQIPPNSTVVHLIPSNAEWALLVCVAALKCYTIAGLPPALLDSAAESELRRRLVLLAPSSIVVENEAAVEKIEKLRDDATSPFLGLCLGPLTTPHRGWMSFCDIAETSFADEEHLIKTNTAPDNPDRTFSIVFTSGSSDLPKGVQRTVRALLASTTAQASPRAGPRPAHTIVTAVVGSNTHTVALGMLYLSWNNARSVVIPAGDFSPAATLHAIERHGVSVIGHSPQGIVQLVRHAKYSQKNVRSLRNVFITGNIATSAELEELRQSFPGASVYPLWGMTEAVGVLGWPRAYPRSVPTHLGVASSGTVMPGGRIRLVDENNCVVQRGVPGELHVGGDVVFTSYVGRAAFPSLFYADECGRWFKTGDVAVLDDDGNVYILGRVQDVIKRKGLSLFPATIENCLMRHFKEEVRVVGVPSSDGGELPYAVFEKTTPGEDAAVWDIDKIVRRIGPEYYIGGAVCLRQLGLYSWPRFFSEKVSRRELKRAVLDYMESTGASIQESCVPR
ncbi:hypothetical protein LLEC1_01402 [Akanthomyces lecanii]|uniref:AMP-dependent synthetase/ligase domain-containing protein n=1 Tax=Cordyceps confragosa TaxID=2714763 RepID=A0A179IW39_CORDF|nr:hypothetical protein LLEC1_01402 [Akanthomyces lecanii]